MWISILIEINLNDSLIEYNGIENIARLSTILTSSLYQLCINLVPAPRLKITLRGRKPWNLKSQMMFPCCRSAHPHLVPSDRPIEVCPSRSLRNTRTCPRCVSIQCRPVPVGASTSGFIRCFLHPFIGILPSICRQAQEGCSAGSFLIGYRLADHCNMCLS